MYVVVLCVRAKEETQNENKLLLYIEMHTASTLRKTNACAL